ncbi:hypothetical protein [Neobacillus sp. DY30]|uniref:hypothetical protein n=1 Tax=Neobacillus sp. DY30 TaxID=3047871 RepID=UPI0024C0C344|nr:hypothetical protein [Neobacillus sp. DY30]WHY01926.1 hypothetical protein QNH29_06775 [Neobacillus sp. DY30]
MTRQTSLIVYAILFIIILLSPYWFWLLQPSKELNVLIYDKTVPDQTYREHKGLVWILNNAKYVKENKKPYDINEDYKGFIPKDGQQYTITSLPENLKNYDVYYLTDQYGVYEEDFIGENETGERSSIIYGGLESSDVDRIEQALLSSKGKTLIAEFNTFASPTPAAVRDKIANLLNLEWTGWIGRYFPDLNNKEVPVWVREQYKANGGQWAYKGEGFVFVSKNNEIVVVDEKNISESGALFKLTKKGENFFNRELQGEYQYWFDINSAGNKDEVLAEYHLPITAKKKEELLGLGIPADFPAIIHHQNARYNSYYFSGDYADEAEVPAIYQTKGIDLWKQRFGTQDSFYWEVYVPMMKSLLDTGLNKTLKQEEVEVVEVNKIKTNSKTGDSYIQVQKNGEWNDFLIKGVNMGIGKPGYFPGETSITKEEYSRWFRKIGEMNANAIRIYTLHPPEFYEAFYEYNLAADKPLFLFHGSWVNEEKLIQHQDAFAPEVIEDAQTEIKHLVDVIHGQAELPVRPGHASGIYKYDISKYVLGIIVGTEWDPYMVTSTNLKHMDIKEFDGVYFKTTNASAFEIWLAQLMEYTAAYETTQYNWQHSISFTNWVTTDLLAHPSEPLENEDLVSINPNHILSADRFFAGLFASYHIYPYYPDFLNYEKKYLDYVDSTGKKNNYAGYLNDLIASHKMPVLVAEFGVPSSRGLTHKNAYGMNQGFHSEEEQGKINQRLFKSIVSEGYAGGLIFTWQDEWFKRTWNTMDFDNPDRRPYWNNQQTNEQHFGLLSFEPGEKDTAILVDGNPIDWKDTNSKTIFKSSETKEVINDVKISSDSGYLYFLLSSAKPINFAEQSIYLLLDTIGEQGQNTIHFSKEAELQTDLGVDFLISLTGEKSSRVMVDSYYDTYYYLYAHMLNMEKREPYPNQKNNGVFHPIRLALNKELTIPSTNILVPFEGYETGVLQFGNANPEHEQFNSLTDVSMSSDKKIIEIRIPWQLVNVKDPSLKEAMGDVWKNGLAASETIERIRIAAAAIEQGKLVQTIPKQSNNNQLLQKDVFLYSWNKWEQPLFYERLKKSYGIIKETYEETRLEK